MNLLRVMLALMVNCLIIGACFVAVFFTVAFMWALEYTESVSDMFDTK